MLFNSKEFFLCIKTGCTWIILFIASFVFCFYETQINIYYSSNHILDKRHAERIVKKNEKIYSKMFNNYIH